MQGTGFRKKKAKKTKNAEVEIQCIKENIPGKSIKENIKITKLHFSEVGIFILSCFCSINCFTLNKNLVEKSIVAH